MQPATADAQTKDVHGKRYCAGCSPGLFRRVNRATLLERTLMTWLGFFPWECVSCRRKRFFRDSGRKSKSTVAA